MTSAFVFIMLWSIMTIAKATPIGRFVRRAMVEIPAQAMNGLDRVHVAIATVVLLLVVLHAVAGDNDPVRLIGFIAPEIAIWLTGFEIGILLDAAAGAAAAYAAMRRIMIRRNPLGNPRTLSKRPQSAAGRARSHRRRTPASPANDDEDGGVVVALAS